MGTFDELNAGAQFLAADLDDDGTLPCLVVGGVQVYVYVDDDGTLVISGDFDTSELADERGLTPVRVTMSGVTVWSA